jgi:hypothetical protein
MNNNKTTASASAKGGIGFVGLLTIAFIVLKLTNVIAWSWVWVLAPLWISAILSVVLVIIGIMSVLIAVNKMVE